MPLQGGAPSSQRVQRADRFVENRPTGHEQNLSGRKFFRGRSSRGHPCRVVLVSVTDAAPSILPCKNKQALRLFHGLNTRAGVLTASTIVYPIPRKNLPTLTKKKIVPRTQKPTLGQYRAKDVGKPKGLSPGVQRLVGYQPGPMKFPRPNP